MDPNDQTSSDEVFDRSVERSKADNRQDSAAYSLQYYEKRPIPDSPLWTGVARVENHQGQRFDVRVSGTEQAIDLYAAEAVIEALELIPLAANPDSPDESALRDDIKQQLEFIWSNLEYAGYSDLVNIQRQLAGLARALRSTEAAEQAMAAWEATPEQTRRIEIIPLLEPGDERGYLLTWRIDPTTGSVGQGFRDVYAPQFSQGNVWATVTPDNNGDVDLNLHWRNENGEPKVLNSRNGAGQIETIQPTAVASNCELWVIGRTPTRYTIDSNMTVNSNDLAMPA